MKDVMVCFDDGGASEERDVCDFAAISAALN